MTPEERLDKLAHELARRVPGDTSSDLPDDQQLLAYLDGSQDEQVERQLASNVAARNRLATLAGLAPPAAPDTVRTRVLALAAVRRTAWPRRLGLAAAAVIVTGLGLAVFLNSESPRSGDSARAAFAGLDYDVRISALAPTRSAAPIDDDLPTAFADTEITLRVTPDISTSLPIRITVFAGRLPQVTRIEPLAASIKSGAAEIRFRPDQISQQASDVLDVTVVIGLEEASAQTLAQQRNNDNSEWKIVDRQIRVLARDP